MSEPRRLFLYEVFPLTDFHDTNRPSKRKTSTEGYPAVGVPYYCEYVYGQLLRAVESKGKPLVLHTHVSGGSQRK